MIKKFRNFTPNVSEEAYVSESADIIGNVNIEEDCSIWFGTVLRGDINSIKIGKGSNIQDNCTVHVDENSSTVIGEGVTIGHNSIIHGCKLGNDILVGMGSIILNDAEIGDNTIIGAGSLVTGNKKIPSGVLCLGSPAKVVRKLTEDEIQSIKNSYEHYIKISKEYK